MANMAEIVTSELSKFAIEIAFLTRDQAHNSAFMAEREKVLNRNKDVLGSRSFKMLQDCTYALISAQERANTCTIRHYNGTAYANHKGVPGYPNHIDDLMGGKLSPEEWDKSTFTTVWTTSGKPYRDE